MGNKLPQPTGVLISRLQRLARKLDRLLAEDWAGTSDEAAWRARSNLCWQAAARLEELLAESQGNR
jgi:hypothetical protein